MLNRIDELKNKATERANYYSRIDFPNLANEFTELVNILNEIEDIVRERDALKVQIQLIQQEGSNTIIETAPVQEEKNEI